MATHSSILAWRIPWTEEPGGLQSMELQRVGHDLALSLFLSACGIFPDQGANLCPLHWQEDSYPLYHHQGSPSLRILNIGFRFFLPSLCAMVLIHFYFYVCYKPHHTMSYFVLNSELSFK